MTYPYVWREGNFVSSFSSNGKFLIQNFIAKCQSMTDQATYSLAIPKMYICVILVFILLTFFLHLSGISNLISKLWIEDQSRKLNEERRVIDERYHKATQEANHWGGRVKERGLMGEYAGKYREEVGVEEAKKKKEGRGGWWVRFFGGGGLRESKTREATLERLAKIKNESSIPATEEKEGDDKPDALRGRAKEESVPIHSSKLPDEPGEKILKYSWEDGEDAVRVYITSLPGYDTWSEANVENSGVSCYWDDRQSLLLLIHNGKGEKWYLHVPMLFADVVDAKAIWKLKKLLVKMVKRKNDPWPTLGKEPPPPPKEDEDDNESFTSKDGKKTTFLNKASLPFGDDLNEFVDKAADGDIDIDSKVRWE